jgi:hypothetical protein
VESIHPVQRPGTQQVGIVAGRSSLLCLGVVCAVLLVLWALGRSASQADRSMAGSVASEVIEPVADQGSDLLMPSTTIDPAPTDQGRFRLPISVDAPATLTVTVVTKGSCNVVPGATVEVTPSSTTMEADIQQFLSHASRSPAPEASARATTDASGEAVLNLDCGVEYLVQASVSAEGRSIRVPHVPGLSPGEDRRLTVELPPAEEGHYFVLVLARESRKPVIGARAGIPSRPTWQTSKDLEPSQDPAAAPAHSISDECGLIDLRLPSRQPAKVAVAADGYAPALLIANGKNTADRAQVVFLDRSGDLEVSVIDRHGAPVAGAFGELSVEPASLFQPIETSTVFARQFGRVAWAFETDPAGKGSIQGLPPGVLLEARLARTRLGLRQVVDKLTVESGKLRRVTLICPGE